MKKIFILALLLLSVISFVPTKSVSADTQSYIYVDVKGEVNSPGVYRLSSSSRVFQAIELAGGLTSEAYTRNVNLAKILTDEEIIYIPIFLEESEESNLININESSKEELMLLPGIGEVLADNIINYRNNNGLFSNISEIMKVDSIKEGIYEKIKAYITV